MLCSNDLNGHRSNLTSELTAATMITLKSMCILPVTAILVVSETCAASEVTYVLKIELRSFAAGRKLKVDSRKEGGGAAAVYNFTQYCLGRPSPF